MTPSALQRDAFLAQIPTETTAAERSLLFDFFARRWDGAGQVVEIGPFLGGTTRAIACGMLANPQLSSGALLHTYDRYDAYYSPEELRRTVEPLVQNGGLAAAQADELCRTADFEQLFQAIHLPHEYSRLVRLHNSPLPDLPGEMAASTAMRHLDEAGELGAIFVDGCKSWASTRYAMEYLLPRTRVGAAVIFQDFGWYTCFWISSAVHALREFLDWDVHADATYVFHLNRKITADDVAKCFARTPQEMSETFYRKAAAALLERSRTAGDIRGELIAQLHHVAALLTTGHRSAAADILKGLEVRRYAAFAGMIRGCLKSPTYLPGGKEILWKEAA